MKKLITTLCIIHQHPKVLLGMKKRGFATGVWNGFGGKVQEGESIEEATKREMKEESGINLIDLNKIGVLKFEFENNPEIIEVHIFKSENFSGEPTESEEMNPRWFHVDEIPFEQMWPDDIFWMPMFLEGKKFKGKFLFNKPSGSEYKSKILKKELIEVREI